MQTSPVSPSSDGTPELLAAELDLGLVHEIARVLTSEDPVSSRLTRVVELLDERCGMSPTILTVIDDSVGGLRVAAVSGAEGDVDGVHYRIGEGVTGRVVETGKPVVVPRTSLEPMLVNRVGLGGMPNGGERSFVCVPVACGGSVVGSLGVGMPFDPGCSYTRVVVFLEIVASLLAQAMHLGKIVDAERRSLLDENLHLKAELRERYDFSNLVGTSSGMRQVYQQITQVASSGTTVLIRGESGTGKELIAHAIHYNSPRSTGPFVRVNCAALPESLVESELFGYERGAFTGATGRKKGRFEVADGGTLFLDEIGDLSPGIQIRLLRVLQEREFERVGGTATVSVDVRIITATNRDLETAVADGSFREDLYYRLNVFPIHAPPLRHRKGDILLLADHFLEKLARDQDRAVKRIATSAIEMLTSYHWPGNVRELENAIERAALVCEGEVIHGYHLPPTLQTAEGSGTVVQTSLAESVASFEKDILLDTLKTTRGNKAKAARLLATTERIVGYKVKKYGIDCRRFAD